MEGRAIRLIAYDPKADFTVEPWLPEGQQITLDAASLPKVRMPNRDGFIPRFPERMPQ